MPCKSILVISMVLCASCAFGAGQKKDKTVVPETVMQRIYDEVRTPYKYGIVIRPEGSKLVDCPNVFRDGNKWYMNYVYMTEVGYETMLAESDDLLHWKSLGTVLPLRKTGWDAWQGAGSLSLVDPAWGGSSKVQAYQGKYWATYIGGDQQGYEPDPLSIGAAWTTTPTKPVEWIRYENNPVMTIDQADARPFERKTLYKSHVIWDKKKTLGAQFVMYYNGKQLDPWIERIGMAVSDDMVHWKRYGDGPVIDNGSGISGDPQIVRIGDVWVMFYFGAFWQPAAFDTFACSYDMVHWTKWTGKHLVEPSEPFDKEYAHKPWLVKHNGVIYHFYCTVGSEGRCIAVATSKDMKTAK